MSPSWAPLAPKFKVHPSTLRAIAQLCNFLPLVCSERSSDVDNMAQPPPLCVDVLSKPLQLPSAFFFFFCCCFSFRLPPRAQCLPQHGGPRSQQHSASSGLRQAADPAAVRALLPTSSPLRPQCRTTPEERHPVAGRVSRRERHGFRFFSLLGCWAPGGGEGTQSERKVCRVGLIVLLCLMRSQACTRARTRTPWWRLVFMHFHSADFKFSAAPVVQCRPQVKCHLIDNVTAQWPTCCPFD